RRRVLERWVVRHRREALRLLGCKGTDSAWQLHAAWHVDYKQRYHQRQWRVELKVAVELAFINHATNHQVYEYLFGNQFMSSVSDIIDIGMPIECYSVHEHRRI